MKRVTNADPYGTIALQGYDPVAFHTAGRALKGNPYITTEHFAQKYLFASEENRDIFLGDPEKYLPLFGGFCAFGVSLGGLFPVEIETWRLVDGRLMLQFSNEFKEIFEKDFEENLRKAETNWIEIEKHNGLFALSGG